MKRKQKIPGNESNKMTTPVYLDHHATTPVDPRVLDAMLPYFSEVFGNPSSRNHRYGWNADDGVQQAREQVASLLGAKASEIVFTSGATEADNLAVLGGARAHKDRGQHIVTTQIEHKAVLDACGVLEGEGFEVSYVAPSSDGRVHTEQIRAALRNDTVLVSCMWINNEVGSVQPIAEIGALCRERNILFHVDAVQGLSVLPFDVESMNVDLVSITAHKMYGPKGVGALYVKRRPPVRLAPLSVGGGQERGMRAGTLNVPGIVGLGAASQIAQAHQQEEGERLSALRDFFWHGLQHRVGEVQLHGALSPRHPGNLSVAFGHCDAESIMLATHDLMAVSAGSACSSSNSAPSHVLRALRISNDVARSTIRFGLGRSTTQEELERVLDRLEVVIREQREASPVYLAAKATP